MRNKRFYRVSAQGEAVLTQLFEEWEGINTSLRSIAQGRPEIDPNRSVVK